jgi:hypothetical protein
MMDRMEIINENAFASAKYDTSTKVVYYHFVGQIRVPLGMETLKKVMAFAQARPIKGIVSNLSKLQGTFTGATEFFEKEYYPHMIKNGLCCTAIIVSNDIFTKYAVKELTKRVGNFHLHVFEDASEAERWVLQVANVS